MGIVSGATLKLVPALADRVVAWVGLPSIHAARELLLHCEAAAGSLLEGFEVMPRACLEAVLDYLPEARSPLDGPHAWHALIELAADAEAAATLRERAEALLADAFERGLAEDAVLSANEAQAEAFWTLRDSASPAERAKGPAMQHDISVPVARMADFVAAAAPAIEAEFPGTQALAFGHLGDGNVHFHVLAPAGVVHSEWAEGQGKAISARVHDLVTQWHGSISAEHGIGQMKRDELARLGDPVALGLLRSVKAALDPQGLMNPGKLLAPGPNRP
jgi:FAD/FMN-containing dehydrogenase